MSTYSGCKCAVCDQLFADGDDIVVCPDCGTPYHRACWQKTGVCLFAQKHGDGFEWRRADSPADSDNLPCPACGAANPAGARFCNNCGKPLSDAAAPPRVAYPGTQSAAAPDSASPNYQSSQNAQNAADIFSYQLHLDPEDVIDGIKAKDWAAYVGKSSPFYLLSFRRMTETGRKIAVSFSAFLFGPIYFFYRKAWKPAVFFTVISLLLMIPDLMSTFFIASGQAALRDGSAFSLLASVCYYLNLVQMFLRGAFAVYLYKKDAATKITAVCGQLPEGKERSYALARIGGTSTKAVVLFVVATMVLYLAFTYFLVGSLGTQGITNMMNYLGY